MPSGTNLRLLYKNATFLSESENERRTLPYVSQVGNEFLMMSRSPCPFVHNKRTEIVNSFPSCETYGKVLRWSAAWPWSVCPSSFIGHQGQRMSTHLQIAPQAGHPACLESSGCPFPAWPTQWSVVQALPTTYWSPLQCFSLWCGSIHEQSTGGQCKKWWWALLKVHTSFQGTK